MCGGGGGGGGSGVVSLKKKMVKHAKRSHRNPHIYSCAIYIQIFFNRKKYNKYFILVVFGCLIDY